MKPWILVWSALVSLSFPQPGATQSLGSNALDTQEISDRAPDMPAGAPARLAIGKTGIHCVMEPCPWRGIRDLDKEATNLRRLLWSGPELPALAASAQDTARVRDAWSNHECLEVDGRFDGHTLHVDKITGPCP